MPTRTSGILPIYCFASAMGMVAISVAALFGLIQGSSAWCLLGAIMLGFCGFAADRTFRAMNSKLTAEHTVNELLQARIDGQQRAVDSLADGLDVAIFVCDTRAMIVYANLRASQLFDFQDPRGRPVLAVTLSHDLEALVLEAHRTASTRSGELTFTFPRERVGLVKAWVYPEERDRVFLSIYDVTDLRRLERVRQDFVANVSHELRTPMTLIRSMSETLLDDAEPGSQSERYLGKIIGEVDRLSSISQDLLILTSAESNPVRKHTCDIADVFRSTFEQLSPRAESKGLQMNFQGPERCLIEANPAQMIQVAINLIENAINYTATGSVTVTVQCSPETSVITVADTGIGISSEHQSRVFERFYRVDKARSRSTGGTGLGLSIVRHIVEAHGGQITIDSALHRGSKFTVSLPVQ